MPRINNSPKPNRPKKFKCPSVKKSQKYLITQDNQFIYAKYGDITANELKFFYYVISKLNSISDKDFELHEVPVSEILGEVLSHESEDNYTYIKNLCRSLSKRILEDETLVFDPVTNKKEEMFEVMAIFKRIQYLKRKAVICYQLNDCLKPYLLGLRKNFTQIPLQHILPIRSGYAIRIYQILLSELKQNKNETTRYLIELQDILCVPKSYYKWKDFKNNVLEPSLKEINATTDIVASYRTKKERQKITQIVFEICYKDLQKRKDQAKDKEQQRIQIEVIKPLTELVNKTLAYPTDPLDENAIIALVYRGMHEIKEVKGKLQVVLTLEEVNNPRKKQPLIISNAHQIEKLKAMHENYEKKFFTQNASKILKNKDGSGLAFSQQIQENLKKRNEEDKPKTTPNTKAMAMIEKIKKRNVADLFSNNTQEDSPNQWKFFSLIPIERTCMPTKDLSKLIEKLNHEKNNAIKNGIYHLIQIKFSYNSNRIEGSSLTYEQTAHIFDKSALITEKNENIRLDDIFETINHFECVNYLLESYKEPLSLEYLKTLHKILKNNCSDEIIGGFKKHPNFVGDSATTRPQLVESELTNLLQRYHSLIATSLENIIDFHVAFEKIHPFSDGNGRVGRLVMFKECLKNNIMPFIIENEHKAFYYRGIREYHNTKGYLKDTILQSQDNFNEMVSYFFSK